MEIHKPKAAHSWREFLIEIGTIICGILIALGLEQAVEAVHRNGELRETRDALGVELRENVARLRLIEREEGCFAPQLDAYAAWARGAAKPPQFRFYGPGLRTSNWESAKTTVVPHMAIAERTAWASQYDMLSNLLRVREMQMQLHFTLVKYNNVVALSPSQRDGLVETIAQERRVAQLQAYNAAFVIDQAERLGVPHEGRESSQLAQNRAGIDWVCNGGAFPHPAPARP